MRRKGNIRRLDCSSNLWINRILLSMLYRTKISPLLFGILLSSMIPDVRTITTNIRRGNRRRRKKIDSGANNIDSKIARGREAMTVKQTAIMIKRTIDHEKLVACS